MKETTLSVIYDFGNRRTVTKHGTFDDHLDYLAGLSREEIAGLTLVNRDELNSDEKSILEGLRGILKCYTATQKPGDLFDKQGECMCSMEYSGCSCPDEKEEFPSMIDPRHPHYANAVPQWVPREMFDAVLYTSQLLGGSLSPSSDEDDCDCEEDGFCFHDDECDCNFGCENCEPAPVMSNEPNVNILSDADNIRRIARNRILEDLRGKISDALSAAHFNPVVTFRAGFWLSAVLFEKGYDHYVRNTDEEGIMEYDIYLAGFED